MSFDLALWRGSPVDPPATVYRRLDAGKRVNFLAALGESLITAFRAEFAGDTLRVSEGEGGTHVAGRGWEFTLEPAARFVVISCSMSLGVDDDAVTRLVRAGLRADCTIYDPQHGRWWDPEVPSQDWTDERFSAEMTAEYDEEEEDEEEEDEEEAVEESEETGPESEAFDRWESVVMWLLGEREGELQEGTVWMTRTWTDDPDRSQLVAVRRVELEGGDWVAIHSPFASLATIDLVKALELANETVFGLIRSPDAWALQTSVPLLDLTPRVLDEILNLISGAADEAERSVSEEDTY